MRISLALILLAPLAEIASLILVGQALGVMATLGLVLLAGIVGVFLLRIQGAGILRRLQTEASKGVDPGRELVHASLLVVAAFLLLVPGFVGDVIGLLLFLPFVRDIAWRLAKPRIVVKRSGFTTSDFSYQASKDASVVDLDEDEYRRDPKPGSPWRGPRIGDR
ncbi:FxsA cytoplasmic membrane protein [Rhizobium sp. PDO1-076]|uniref:FxsA family protein n=1 Tax=Rhizobium sp. PDO1-076 TaxID=1125979 RepID=UPI00024E32AF|nr:FxsA family protein [Rhizobium sp. PDO1-076]EHS50281.1 FxsA cytoplasmic membrane protein [Rhizobium sp. PDO1-076]